METTILAWVKEMLASDLKSGMTVIWDNATFHKSPKIREAFAEAGIDMIFYHLIALI